MTKTFLLIGCLALVFGTTTVFHCAQSKQTHDKWLEERYKEATSIKEGMTVAELRRMFTEDGGLQFSPTVRYVLRSCAWIKIDVEFDFPKGAKHQFPPAGQLKIKKISKPYLEKVMYD